MGFNTKEINEEDIDYDEPVDYDSFVGIDTSKYNNNKIEVLDYIMGSGKSTYILDYMTKNPCERYMYVTTLLSEADDRALDAAASIDIQCPASSKESNKSDHLLELLKVGANISCTHSLFTMLTLKHIEEIHKQGYTLIIDEVVDFIEAFNDYSMGDITDLVKREDLEYSIEELGRVRMKWRVSKSNHFYKLMNLCDTGMLYCTKNGAMLTAHIPPTMIKAAKKVIVCTYMYKASLMHKFMQLHNFEYEYIKDDNLEARQEVIKRSIKDNLILCNMSTAGLLGRNDGNALSYGWYGKNSSGADNNALKLFKKVSNWLRTQEKEERDNFFFTCPKGIVDSKLSSQGIKSVLTKSKLRHLTNSLSDDDSTKWLFSGTKATNNFKDRLIAIHALNVFSNIVVKRYLHDYGFVIDEDLFATSEMVQFLWRGCIRKGEPMKVLVLAPRMRLLLERFIDNLW